MKTCVVTANYSCDPNKVWLYLTKPTLNHWRSDVSECEESDDGLWLNLYFESVPGDYVCQFADSVLDKAAWEAGRDEVLAILGTAQFGRNAMTEQAAIDAAAAQYDGEYDTAYGRYSVVDGCWTVTFSKGAAGENSKSFKITPQGSVTAAE